MKIVFFTNKCSHGEKMLRQMNEAGIIIDHIFIMAPRGKIGNILTNKVKIYIKRGLYKKLIVVTSKYLLDKIVTLFSKHNKKPWIKNNFYFSYSNNVFITNNFNNLECQKKLEKIGPDLIILGGSGIIKKNIIKIPKIGILNAHPGLLPKYRGVDVVPWAIYNNDEIGATVHFIDIGVDTGNIVCREPIQIKKGSTIKSLKKEIEIVAAKLMVKTILGIQQKEKILTISQKNEEGRQYYKMPHKLLKKTEKILKDKTIK